MNKVLLAPNDKVDFDSSFLHWPMYGSRKYDGNRNLLYKGQFYSRTLKPQPNIYLNLTFQQLIEYSKKNNLVFDGELWSPTMTFSELQSIIRADDANIPTHVGFYIFDMMTENEWENENEPCYRIRYEMLMKILRDNNFSNVFLIEQEMMYTPEEAEKAFEDFITEGYEGLMLRSLHGRYKHNRASLKDDIIYKFKEFQTDDAVIVDVVQGKQMKSSVKNSEREIDEQGHTKRSHKKDDYELADTSGSLIVKMKDGTEVGIGFGKQDAEEKKKIWEQHKAGGIIGKWIEFSWMPHGTKDKPRIGKLERFRPDLDR